MNDTYGPRTDFGKIIHSTKYRAPEEKFDDYAVRWSRATTDNDKDFRRALRYTRGQELLPAGRQQHSMGRPYLTTAFNCFVGGDIPDSYEGIMDALKWAGMTLRTGGGVGWNFSTLRPEGEPIRGLGHGSFSSGPLSFMDLWDINCKTILTAGHRRGAMMSVLDVTHPDIMKFVRAKQGSGRFTNFNMSVALYDIFMEALYADGLYDLKFGETKFASVRATDVWAAIMESNWDWAEPGGLFMDRINQRNPLYYCERINGTNPSMPAGTLVNTRNGIFPIEALNESTFEVKSLDGEWAQAKCFLSSPNADLLEIDFGGGRTIRCTEEHKWPVLLNGRYVKVAAADLRSGDYIPTNRNERLGHTARPDLLYKDGLLAGIAFGDGSYNVRGDDGRAYLHIHCNRIDLDLQEISATYFGAKISESVDECVVHVSSDREVRAFVSKVGLKFGDKSHLPETVWTANDDFVAGFIDGLFSTDGYVGDDVNRCMILTNKNETVIHEVGVLLAFHGVVGTVSAGETKLNGKVYPRFDLRIPHNSSKQFGNLFSLSCGRKMDRLQHLCSVDTRTHINSTNLRVTSIRKMQVKEPVWDISVYHDQHVFPTEWVYTGNCAEQPLPPWGACLLGSVNLVKMLMPARMNGNREEGLYVVESSSGRYDIDYELLDDVVDCAVRCFDMVPDRTNYPLPQQKKEALDKRRMGVGVTGMANAIEIIGHSYGSPGYIEVQSRILERIALQAYRTSIELAKERGVFPLFDEKYLDGWFVKNVLNDEIRDGIKKHGLRNGLLLSIAPTGTISMAADNVSSGIEPPYSVNTTMDIEMPDGKTSFDVVDYAKQFFDVTCRTANEVTAEQHIDVLCAAQRYVDSSVSKTCNVNGQIAGKGPGVTYADFQKLYTRAYDGGAKGATTFNRNGKLMGVRRETGEPDEGAACRIDGTTGLRTCDE